MVRDEVTTYYDENYFAFQRDMGEFSGWAETPKFAQYIPAGATVIDFGCGGGFILKNLNCARKIGVEINDTARMVAKRENGLEVVKFAHELKDSVADVIISNHALEHCFSPHAELSTLLDKLKPGGRIVFYVPCESIDYRWKPDNVHMHLYTWNPMTLGNLFISAGYEVEGVDSYFFKWPPRYRTVAKFGRRAFDAVCHFYGLLTRNNSQVRVVARKKAI
ncbi:class I SAM-dependent methyltransferase [Geomesophilobacter sediminis]|uniref:Class I SAM-dependent methyltransferase n=1 Tax=Geomesophilobacter sediminis TaxID=2798584 RepID=A0A8J7JFX0_9BACT|nr:class I SAM-dependent methyltransferase [Geomesophilobacter sediminis]MBJ6723165.1 class I SAM-dependent methyltransferase [Geomesophilobacter sediminis]